MLEAVLTWVDEAGAVRRVSLGKLHPTRIANHAALRAFVYRRDQFACRKCGLGAINVPKFYDGRATLHTGRLFPHRRGCGGWPIYLVLDHTLSRMNGGTNHPSNLQTFCFSCNAAKVGLVDAKSAAARM